VSFFFTVYWFHLTDNSLGLFAPRAGQHYRDEQRRRKSKYDRGTRLAEMEENELEFEGGVEQYPQSPYPIFGQGPVGQSPYPVYGQAETGYPMGMTCKFHRSQPPHYSANHWQPSTR